MGDPITWGLITKVKSIASSIKTTVESTQTTVDTLPEKVEQKLDPVQTDMTQLAENVQKQVDELREIVENSPAGVPAPWLESISSASQEDGINVTYKARFLQGRVDSTENWLFGQTNGVMVRYSDENYPMSRTDGTLAFIDEDLFTVSENGTVTAKTKSNVIVGLTNGEKYFISAFPYSTYNIYNESLNQGSGLNNTTSCTWSGTKGTLTVNVTQDYDYKPLGEYTATMTPTAGGQAVTKTQSGAATIVFSGLEAGEYTLSFSAPQYFTAPQSESVTVVAGQSQTVDKVFTFSSGSLSDASWELIDDLSKQASNFWSVGDTKDIVVNGETLTVEIIGFNHDDLADGSGKAGITFGMKNLMANTRNMNPTNTNAGGYEESEMFSYVNTTIFQGMDSELKNVIKEIKKDVDSGPNSSVYKLNMKVFLFSETEVFGSSNEYKEGSKYARFTSNTIRTKKLGNGTGDNANWYLRTSDKSRQYWTGVRGDYPGQNGKLMYPMNNNGVCFGFCI